MPSFMDALSAAKGLASGLADPSSLLASFASAFSQGSQALKLHCSSDAGIPAGTLLPHRLTGHQGINQGLHLELEVVSNDASLELKTLLGVAVQVSIVTDAGSEHELSGLVTEVHQEGSEGGFASYRLVIEDGLSILRLARSARVAMDVDVLDLTDTILQAHLDDNPVLAAAFQVDNRCKASYPDRPFWMQFNETDADYLRRIWAREGISYVVMSAEGSTPDHPQHVLVLFDDPMDLDQNASSTVRFHRSDSTEQADTITGWNGRRTLQSGSVARSAWDHTTASVTMASEDSKADQGDGGAALSSSLEDYLHEASLEGDDAEAFSARTKLRMQAREGWAKRFDGSGTVRTFAAGTWFTLQEHPIHDHDAAQDREFVLASVDVEAVNNLPKDLSEGLAGLLSKEKTGTVQKPGESYRNTFVCVRRGIPILPDEIAPPNPGILTATVSGPPGEVVHTDELGRIKVTFHFARPDDHPEAGATGTDADSAWIRQIETASSSGFGASFVPRVGDEVVVQFMGGDPDRPLIIGSLSNSASPPTAFAGISGLPGDKALTGIRSQMHGGFGGNQLVLDDTKGQLRTQLASDHADSALNLGFLVQPRSGGVGAVRGEGAELCSAASTAVRGDKGLLLSAESASSQMGRGVAMGNLNAALALSKTLGETAEKHGTDALEVKPQEELVKLLDDWEKGSATDPKGEGGQPVILASAPAGLALSSGKATTLQAGSNLDLVAMGQAQLSAGKRLLLLALESVSIFAHKLGMKLIAADGDMSIQAQNGKMESIAAKDLSLMSVDGMVTIDSAKGIMLRSGGGYILIKDGKIDFVCPEVQTFKSASQTFAASSSQDAATAALPKSGTRQAN